MEVTLGSGSTHLKLLPGIDQLIEIWRNVSVSCGIWEWFRKLLKKHLEFTLLWGWAHLWICLVMGVSHAVLDLKSHCFFVIENILGKQTWLNATLLASCLLLETCWNGLNNDAAEALCALFWWGIDSFCSVQNCLHASQQQIWMWQTLCEMSFPKSGVLVHSSVTVQLKGKTVLVEMWPQGTNTSISSAWRTLCMLF